MTQLLNALAGALAQGLIWGVMAIGVYITYKVLDIADLTVDGSICTGAAVCTMLLLGGQSPWLALLDEHTAALDPQTAQRVMDITDRLVRENHLTTLMITHNMHDALTLGNRTLMMADGGIVLDVAGAERAGMTVEDLVERFRAGTGRTLDNDRMLLSE